MSKQLIDKLISKINKLGDFNECINQRLPAAVYLTYQEVVFLKKNNLLKDFESTVRGYLIVYINNIDEFKMSLIPSEWLLLRNKLNELKESIK